jgi:ribose transport system ATP-binding protein
VLQRHLPAEMTTSVKQIQLFEVTKRFPGVDALKSFSLTFNAGEVVGLVGENGAGKSTLIKILSGAFAPSSGYFSIDGRRVAFETPRDSEKAGIRTIFQELNLCPHLSVAENILLGKEPRVSGVFRPFFIDQKALKSKAKEVLDHLAVTLPLDSPVDRRTIAEQQLIEIAKALVGEASFLIMDEPTSSLSGREIANLLDLIPRLKRQGRIILFVSHRLDEVLSVADRIVVLRDGQLVGELEGSKATHEQIIQLMVGRTLELKQVQRQAESHAEPLLVVKNLVTTPGRPPVSFSLMAGEILCLAGLVGAGRSDILHAIFCSKRSVTGEVLLHGRSIAAKHPQERIRQGVGFVPEDRKMQGVILQMSVAANLTLPALGRFTDFGLINGRREWRCAKDLISRYLIRTPSADTPVRNLSGGNQQKVVLAKWFSLKPDLLLIDEPTRGVDVAGKAEIYDLLRTMANSGMGILMVSSEIEEVLRIATRVLVISHGKIAKQLTGAKISEGNILEAMLTTP